MFFCFSFMSLSSQKKNSYKIKRKQDQKMSLCKNGKKLLKNFKNAETSRTGQQEAM